MFKRMVLENAKMRIGQQLPANPANPAKVPEDEFSNFSNFSNGAPSNTHFLQAEDEELFTYLLNSISTGGPYAKLWPNVRNYCRREFTPQQFKKLEWLFSDAS